MPNPNSQQFGDTIFVTTTLNLGGGSGTVTLPATPPMGAQGEPASTEFGLEWYQPKKSRQDDSTDKQDEWYNRSLEQICGFRGPRQKGLIGLEIESEGKNLFQDPFKFWVCHADQSLRETEGHPPVEYVLRQPLNLPELKEALDYLTGKLKESGSSVEMSHRTSVHVHVNCQQYTLRELYKFILLYMVFEEVLIDWSSPERAGNLFCLRAKDSSYFLEMLEATIKYQNFKQWREDVRYTACNVNSILKFGSLEFRSLRGTVDADQIMTWVKLLLNIKTKAEAYGSPLEMVEEFGQIGPLPFFKKIFDDPTQRRLLSEVQGLSGKLWDGLRMARDVAHTCEWKTPLPPTKKKPKPKQEKVNVGPNLFSGVQAGDTISTPWGNKTIQFQPGGNWLIRRYDPVTETVSPRTNYQVPPGNGIFYFRHPETFGSDFIIVNERAI